MICNVRPCETNLNCAFCLYRPILAKYVKIQPQSKFPNSRYYTNMIDVCGVCPIPNQRPYFVNPGGGKWDYISTFPSFPSLFLSPWSLHIYRIRAGGICEQLSEGERSFRDDNYWLVHLKRHFVKLSTFLLLCYFCEMMSHKYCLVGKYWKASTFLIDN